MRYRLMATYQGVPYEAGIGPSDGQVVLFAACPPPEQLGFEPATGHWRKQLSMEYVQALWESRPMGRYRGHRCMVLDDLGDRLHIAYIGHDAFQAQELGYWQVDRGVYELVTPREEVTDITEERSDYFPPRSDTGSMPAINTGTMRAISTGNMPAINTGSMPAVNTGSMPAVNTGSMPAVATGPVPAAGYRPPAADYGPAGDLGAVTTDFGPAPDYSTPPGFGAGPGPGPGYGSGPARGPDPRPGAPRPGSGPGPGPGPGAPGAPGYGTSRFDQKDYGYPAPAGYGPAGHAPAGQAPGSRPPAGPGPDGRGGDGFGPATGEFPVPGGRPRQAPPGGPSPLGDASPLTSPAYRAAGPTGQPRASEGPSALEAAAFRAATGASHSGPLDRDPAEAVPAGPGSRFPGWPGDNASGPIGPRPGAGSAVSVAPGRPGDNASGPIGARLGGQEPPRATPADATSPNVMAAEPALAAAGASASGRTPPPAPLAPVPLPSAPGGPNPGGAALAAVGAPPGLSAPAAAPAASVLTAPPRPAPPLASPGGPNPGSTTLAAPTLAPPAPPAAPARAPLTRPAPGTGLASRPQPGGPPGPDPAQDARRRRRSAQSRAAIRGIFTELASQAAISPAAYAVGEEVDGALCLIESADGFEVFSFMGGARHEVRTFEDEESAYFYLFGVLAAEAVRTGLLTPHR